MLTTIWEYQDTWESNFSSFYFELGDIVNSLFNLGEPIPS